MSEKEQLLSDITTYITELQGKKRPSDEEQKKLVELNQLKLETEQLIASEKKVVEQPQVSETLKTLEALLEQAKAKKAAHEASNAQPTEQPTLQKAQAAVQKTVRATAQSAPAQKAKQAVQTSVSEYKKLSAQTGGYGGLYTWTLIIEFACAIARFVVSFIALLPLFFVVEIVRFVQVSSATFGNTQEAWSAVFFWFGIHLILSLILGFYPVVRSLFFILFPIFRTGASERESDFLGAREPLPSELEIIITTLEKIQTNTNIRLPGVSHWRVIDNIFPESYTIGNTIYLSRGAIEEPFLSGLIAHELGHVQNKDGDLLLSLRQFIIPLIYFVGIDRQPLPAGAVSHIGKTVDSTQIVTDDSGLYYKVKALRIKFLLAFFFGGMGLLLLGRQWARFWRSKDLLADNFVIAVGQAEPLIQVLEQYQHIDVAQPFLLTNRPYTAERLYNLRR